MPTDGLVVRPSDNERGCTNLSEPGRLSNVRSPLTAPRMTKPLSAASNDRSHAACSLVSPIAPVALGFDGRMMSFASVPGPNSRSRARNTPHSTRSLKVDTLQA
jgi:hypothetical protein